ncbi:putative domain HDIG-containing protein [Desulfosporosinus acidiphilus SJ4]|uniref:Putative domain HDIG-containing protein n=1 Tax=Desulfosporosinus acidiphilus (strain DSM 22704 / JCM 16185 / SJ4) TaxID=646529 RepID=I4D6L7_DESAJ|nr:HD domain-containing phosphohydrolase [Desulfosporosinus acidiphilus]AFM41441.1 putative domain HDIG-containing protein [Desulfosporosinus acidiphilus SJ4]
MHTISKIHPISFIKGMSTALELTNKGISKHHLETAIISYSIAQQLQLSQTSLQTLLYAALLHDIGAASNWEEKHLIMHNDHQDSIFNHAESGYRILKDCRHLNVLSIPIRYHHDRIAGGNPSGLRGQDIPLLSRIIHIADRIDVLIDANDHIFNQRNKILDYISDSNIFDIDLIKVVKHLAKTESFWLDIVNSSYQNEFLSDLDFLGKLMFNNDELIEIAEVFSKIVDETSPYTASHSKNVAVVSSSLAKIYGYNDEEIKMFYLAGLLHDLGKLAVPNEILTIPGKLTEKEFDLIKQHPYYSFRILKQIEGFTTIATWVSQHHELLDASGYPFGLKNDKISLGARIITVADIFCALSEDRPYRNGLSVEQILQTMTMMALENKIDSKLVNYICLNADMILNLITKKVIPPFLKKQC